MAESNTRSTSTSGSGGDDSSDAPIAPLQSIASSIFVPIVDDDLIAPFTPPASRIDRLQEKIKHLEATRVQVRSNLLLLFSRECARLIQAAQAQEKAMNEEKQASEQQRGVVVPTDDSPASLPSEDDLAEMVRNMTETADPRTERTIAWSVAQLPDFKYRPDSSIKEKLVIDLEATISKGLIDLRGYENHVRAIKQGYQHALEREIQSDMDLD